MKFSVCLVQMPCTEGKREENFRKAETLLGQYEPVTDCEFIVFPELFAVGFRQADFQKIGPGIPGPTEEFVKELARDKGVYVVVTGLEAHGKRFYNTLIMMTPQGKLLGHYRKIHPFQDERKAFDAGDSLVIFETKKGMKVGVEICYDIRFPEVSRNLALEGADLLLVSAAFPEPRVHHWNTLLLARAIENQFYVAATNRIGKGYDGKVYFGNSQLIDPWGRRLNKLSSTEQIIQLQGDTTSIQEVRELITCYEDRPKHGYPRILWYRENTSVK